MPIYTFECSEETCKHREDLLLRMDDRIMPFPCPMCNHNMYNIIVPGNVTWQYKTPSDGAGS